MGGKDYSWIGSDSSGRRIFIKQILSAGAGLAIGCQIELPSAYAAEIPPARPAPPPKTPPEAFIRVREDDRVVVIVKHLEMGQGTFTGLPTLVAEELDAAWSQVTVEAAPVNAAFYNNLLNGPIQVTGASTSMANSYLQYRLAAATVRAMLVATAAARWNVLPDSIVINQGIISGPRGQTLRFGEISVDAAKQPLPTAPVLKDPSAFRLIGTNVVRTDANEKSTGKAIFTQDFRLPGMLTAVVSHAPRFGGKIRTFDATPVASRPGVKHVIEIPTGVAIVATDFWTAKLARDELSVDWDFTNASEFSSSEINATYRGLCQLTGAHVRSVGSAPFKGSAADREIEAVYEFPYLAHATMEPMNCVIQLQQDRCDAWYAVQSHSNDQAVIAKILGLEPAKVFLHQLLAGGSFGRRASSSPESDYVGEATYIAKALAEKGYYGIPIKLMWTREDDMRRDRYRPAFLHSLQATITKSGTISSWNQRIVGQSVAAGTLVAFKIKNDVDPYSVDGISTMPYAIDKIYIDLHSPTTPVPVLWWRSVGSTHTAFAIETFVDRLASAAGQDPINFRKKMLADKPRHMGVLERVRHESQWRSPLAPGENGTKRARGFAIHEAYDTVVAQVVEVTVRPDKSFTVDRVFCAVDCGLAINPDVVRSQMEGGIGFALSAALYGDITIDRGAVVQSNFHDYQVIRIDEMPKVDVYIIPSKDAPTGVGEPGVPPLAPAVANALAAATGRWLTRMPLRLT